MLLEGKIALVTGASSGIGAAIAKGMARAGAHVAISFHTNERGAERTAEAIQSIGRKALVVRADVGNAESVGKMFHVIQKAFGRLDILVNNAGITLKKPFCSSTEQDWDLVHRTNLKSVFLCSRRALSLMDKAGAILNVSSVHAVSTTFNFSVYAASKGGLEALTRSMAIELGNRQIRVNAIRPGLINVERDAVLPDHPDYCPICDRIPLGRLGEPRDVVPLAVLLCSDEAAYVSGQVITIDGGHEAMLNTAFPEGHVKKACEEGSR